MGSFTDGKPRIATDEDVRGAWCGRRDGAHFRCRLCGYKFRSGDYWRFVYANGSNSPSKFGNFLVCKECDGHDVLLRAEAQENEARTRFWWLLDRD